MERQSSPRYQAAELRAGGKASAEQSKSRPPQKEILVPQPMTAQHALPKSQRTGGLSGITLDQVGSTAVRLNFKAARRVNSLGERQASDNASHLRPSASHLLQSMLQ
ncbi:hypothetical protein V2G26_005988 [Clonostachys chloroleuca]